MRRRRAGSYGDVGDIGMCLVPEGQDTGVKDVSDGKDTDVKDDGCAVKNFTADKIDWRSSMRWLKGLLFVVIEFTVQFQSRTSQSYYNAATVAVTVLCCERARQCITLL